MKYFGLTITKQEKYPYDINKNFLNKDIEEDIKRQK